MSVPTRVRVFDWSDGQISLQVEVTISDQCHACRHRTSATRCAAFPLGIPRVIRNGEVDHTSPFPGDEGVIFEPRLDGAPPDPLRGMLIDPPDDIA